jgi:protein-tyrosine-phosphatase
VSLCGAVPRSSQDRQRNCNARVRQALARRNPWAYNVTMRIMFVCHANVARSQIAAALCTAYAPQVAATSAGVEVDVPGETLRQLARRQSRHNPYVIAVMKHVGLDVRHLRRTQLRAPMLPRYDHVVSMVDEAAAPRYLLDSPSYVYWNIADPARYGPAATMRTEEAVEVALLEFLLAADLVGG